MEAEELMQQLADLNYELYITDLNHKDKVDVDRRVGVILINAFDYIRKDFPDFNAKPYIHGGGNSNEKP